MSELSSTHHCSTVVEEANTSHDSKVDSYGPQHPPASEHGRDGEELKTDSPAGSEDHDTDSDRQDGKVGVAPPLGEREKYHVFFCYSSADAPWVKGMIQTLESDEYGFKCCIHERDFTPGAFVIKNIARSIRESQKTVFVLSRDFVESRWCDFERQLVMSENLREKNRKVIPVMLHKCDLLPDFLRHMTYLEVWTPYFFNRFIGALKVEPDSKPGPFSAFSYDPNYMNGEHVLLVDSLRTSGWPMPSFQFDAQIVPSKLKSRGIQISREDTVAVLDKLQKTDKMKYFTLFYTWEGIVIMALLITLIWLKTTDEAMRADLSPLFGGIIGAVMLRYIASLWMNKAMTRTMVEVNAILVKYHILATVTDNYLGRNEPAVHFVYYERGSCLFQIQEEFKARATKKSPSVDGNTQGDFSEPVVSEERGDAPGTDVHENSSSRTSRVSQLRAEADALLLKYSDQYVRLLVTNGLPQPRQSRGHTQQRACLCQFVEMHEFRSKLDWVVDIIDYWMPNALKPKKHYC
ncbi:TLR2 [Branchiostoma lanceolatum]|nr:TLR2 [Branchiostoma lanceolatum]